MILLIKLVLAHLIGDFLIQPKSWVAAKEKRKEKAWQLYAHVAIHGLVLFILVWDFRIWPLVVLVAGSHGAIDFLKLRFQKKKTRTRWFIGDQLLHILVLAALWVWWVDNACTLYSCFDSQDIWLVVTAILFLTYPMSIVMGEIMRKWGKELRDDHQKSLLNAGKYIGMLERLLVLSFILIAEWEAVGFLLTAKSVFRFGDLRKSKERKLTEYILIGTLLSFGSAIVVGLIVNYLFQV